MDIYVDVDIVDVDIIDNIMVINVAAGDFIHGVVVFFGADMLWRLGGIGVGETRKGGRFGIAKHLDGWANGVGGRQGVDR